MKKMYAIMETSTNGMDNHVPFVVVAVDPTRLIERIADVARVVGETGAASLSYWSDEVAEIEWYEDPPSDWLDDDSMFLLKSTGITYTTKPPPSDGTVARVDASMSVFWSDTFVVRCDTHYGDEWYEGQTIFYSDILSLLKEKA